MAYHIVPYGMLFSTIIVIIIVQMTNIVPAISLREGSFIMIKQDRSFSTFSTITKKDWLLFGEKEWKKAGYKGVRVLVLSRRGRRAFFSS